VARWEKRAIRRGDIGRMDVRGHVRLKIERAATDGSASMRVRIPLGSLPKLLILDGESDQPPSRCHTVATAGDSSARIRSAPPPGARCA
jgi:hypothetical protein